MVRPDDLLVLLEVARSGTFSAAGAALGIDHSTASRRINALESELGQPVLTRSAHGCEVTEFGTGLLERAERIERAMADIRPAETSATAGPLHSGLVRILAPEAFGACFVAPVLASCRNAPGTLRARADHSHVQQAAQRECVPCRVAACTTIEPPQRILRQSTRPAASGDQPFVPVVPGSTAKRGGRSSSSSWMDSSVAGSRSTSARGPAGLDAVPSLEVLGMSISSRFAVGFVTGTSEI